MLHQLHHRASSVQMAPVSLFVLCKVLAVKCDSLLKYSGATGRGRKWRHIQEPLLSVLCKKEEATSTRVK